MSDHALIAGGVARVASAIAPLHGEPRVSTPQTSQLFAGHVVQLLEQLGDWWRVMGADKYEGFMHNGYLTTATGDEATWRTSLDTTVEQGDRTARTLPLNARVAPDAKILSGTVVNAADVTAIFPRSPSAIARSAVEYFAGASYQWGGGTPWGCDCSGLVQSTFALHGVQLPRDAWQQALVGTEMPISSLSESAELLHESDLLFFSDREDRRITHVGIVLLHFRMVHSALGRGGVSVEALNSADSYVQKLRSNFVGARRLL